MDKQSFRIMIGDFEVRNITSFDFTESFGNASSCNFTTITDIDHYHKNIDPSKLVLVYINNVLRLTGAIERVSVGGSGGRDRAWRFSVRDLISQLALHNISPLTKITEKDTMLDALKKCTESCGFIFKFEADDEAYQNIITGKKVGYRSKAKSARGKKRELERSIKKDTQPQHNEGCWTFMERLMKSAGLMGWINHLGDTIHVGIPMFDQSSLYRLVRKNSGKGNNLISSSYEINMATQPAFIYAECSTEVKPTVPGNTDYERRFNERAASDKGTPYKNKSTKLKVICVNEFAGYLRKDGVPSKYLDSVQAVIDGKLGKDATVLDANEDLINSVKSTVFSNNAWNAPGMYLEDNVSKNFDQLAFATKRKMAEAQSKYFSYSCSVPGFSIDGAIPAPNTIANIIDEVNGIVGEYWVKDVSFKCSGGEHTTNLTLIPKHAFSI